MFKLGFVQKINMFKIKIKSRKEKFVNTRISSLMNEVRLELLKVILINLFLDSIMVFFICYFLASFFDVPFKYIIGIPSIITLLFFFILMIKRTNKLKVKVMEDANPKVKEMLRTADDNKNQDNIMTYALFEDLRRNMKSVSTGNLLDSKKIITRIISAITIVFIIIFISTLNINLDKIDIDFSSLIPARTEGETSEGKLTDLIFNETNVIYGDKDVAKLGNEKINLNMNPSMSDIDFNQISDAENNGLREEDGIQDVTANSDDFNNQKLLDNAEQAVNYIQKIKEFE